ncbi:c-type cytochrome [bacterium]|nr:c-type cytochrome [bacterium]MDA7527469.1 c-type cytochrome [bacterium]
MLHRILTFSLLLSLVPICFATDIPESVTNTQVETHPLLSPEDAVSRIKLPPGFRATVFASEPEIRQPIAMSFDAKGRLWVAENDTYAESSVGYDLKQRDRVLIFEDTNGDGHANSRKVFWDEGHHLTSVELGFGGVWVLCAPDLLFIPDANRDDIPDGEPIVMLTGFDNSSIRHNIVNGLKWGPDGWLYGRQGITTTSYVGTPETPEELRTPLNCSVWRFHPQTRQFEVVSHGTTNSWGHDWDENGELFIINTVIGHFWHAISGSHLERMFGEDFNPHLYKLMPQTADHFHWNTTEKWSDIRNTGVTSTTDTAGGGHAHCGMMIYQGTNWPEEYRGDVFTCNLHGLRINRDHLERKEAGFVATHAEDFATSKDLWFRGIDLAHGPDGGVYVLDWSDIGECHENDGIHRTSGRIYKIVYGEVEKNPIEDYRTLSNEQLVKQLTSKDAWHHRMARKTLQERYAAGKDLSSTRSTLLEILLFNAAPQAQLHALWALISTGGLDDQTLIAMTRGNEVMKCWAIQTLAQKDQEETLAITLFSQLAREDPSGLVLQHIASALQRVPLVFRLKVGQSLLSREEFASDRHLPLMIWYAIEPAVAAFPDVAVGLLKNSQYPEVNKFIARRISSDPGKNKSAMNKLIEFSSTSDAESSVQILQGMKEALAGRRKVEPPLSWEKTKEVLVAKNSEELSLLVNELSVTFGDGLALEELRKVAADGNEPFSSRGNAIRALATARDLDSREVLQNLLNERDLAIDAIRGLAVIGDEKTPQVIVDKFNGFKAHVKPVAIETLAARSESAEILLQAVIDNKISSTEIPPFYIRQMRTFNEEGVQLKLQRLYPEWRHTSAEKEERANVLRDMLTETVLSEANASHGRQLFEKTCASCHKLYGGGGKLGPDLTGSQRSNLNYLLSNIVDPSAEVAEKFQMSIIVLEDGRSISGVIQRENEETLIIQTPNEELTLLIEDIAARKNSKLSMMPERQLDKMSNQEIIDLFAYLMSKEQVK